MAKSASKKSHGGPRAGSGRPAKDATRIAINLGADYLRKLDEIREYRQEKRRIESDLIEASGEPVEKAETRTQLIENAIEIAYARTVGLPWMRDNELQRLREARARRDAEVRGEEGAPLSESE